MSYEPIFRGNPSSQSRVQLASPGSGGGGIPPPAPPPAAPVPPVLLSAVPASGQVTLTWSFDSGASSWRVYRALTGDPLTMIAEVYSNDPYIDTSVAADVTYDYAVTALAPETAFSNILVVSTPAPSFNEAPPATIGADAIVYVVTEETPGGKFFISGDFVFLRGTAKNRVARITRLGAVDAGFNETPPATLGANGTARRMIVQSDGKIVIAGAFTTARGITQNRVARLNADGTLDGGFNTGGTIGVNNTVFAMALQPDGKILLGGNFTTARGVTQDRIARLNTDGTLDATFNTGGTVGVSGTVNLIHLNPDGTIIIGGTFTTVRGTARLGYARLFADGTYDAAFLGTANGSVNAILPVAGGQFIIGGSFSTVDSVARPNIARINADGTLDATFGDTTANGGVNGAVQVLTGQPDAKILVGGAFGAARGVSQNRIARLNADGTLDTGFNIGGTVGMNNTVFDIHLQADDKMIVVGSFTAARGVVKNRMCRLLANGTLD